MATMTTQAVWVEKLNWEGLEFAPPSLVEGSGSGSGLVSSISISMTRSLVFVVVVVVVVVVAVAVVVVVSDAVVLGSVAVVVVLGVVLASLTSGRGVDVKGWRSLEAKVAVAVVVVVGSIDDQQCSQSKLGRSNSTVALRICFCFSTVSSTCESGKQKVNILVHSEISMSKARQVALPLTGLLTLPSKFISISENAFLLQLSYSLLKWSSSFSWHGKLVTSSGTDMHSP